MNDVKYFNFPVELLSGFMIDSRKCLDDIRDYAVYEHSLKLEYGNELEKIKDSSSYFGMEPVSYESFRNGKNIYNKTLSNSPKVGFSLPVWWDFYKNKKTEFDKVCLLAFLSIRSIIGVKSYCRVTNVYLWARMDGKTKAVNDKLELSDEIFKYANRYQTTKIINELVLNWRLIYYSYHLRGFFVSFNLSLDNLVFEAEKKRKSIKVKEQKNLVKEARIKALKRMNN